MLKRTGDPPPEFAQSTRVSGENTPAREPTTAGHKELARGRPRRCHLPQARNCNPPPNLPRSLHCLPTDDGTAVTTASGTTGTRTAGVTASGTKGTPGMGNGTRGAAALRRRPQAAGSQRILGATAAAKAAIVALAATTLAGVPRVRSTRAAEPPFSLSVTATRPATIVTVVIAGG